nr:unnamed protein product [Callosobruchus chinensis]CAH7723804.1 unnamed protein product [Callosobruchus chinensis]CAH7724980.1 unnamed protein product [Callosobruchus chinensis]
MDMGILSQ